MKSLPPKNRIRFAPMFRQGAAWRGIARLLFVVVWLAASAMRVLGHGFPDGSFEPRHVHSIALTPDGSRLLALNSPDGRLSIFNIGNSANPVPVLEMEIGVGIEPVSVRARTNDEVWVVNEVSDSVSIVSLSRGTVIATLQVPDEPADVIFAQGKAFVSCARSNLLRVFDAVTRQALMTIPLQGVYPRAMAADAAGAKIFVTFLLSGNGTTVLPRNLAPPPPPPTNPLLPTAPPTALIVPATHADIHYTVLDRDVAEVDVATGTVTRYVGGVGTNLFDIAVNPVTGAAWVANSEARNLVRFEPALRGHVADHRLTQLDANSGVPVIFDLNPGLDYGLLPNLSAQTTALAQPTAIVFSAGGNEMWVAAFGSDRVASISPADGTVLSRIEMRSTGQTSRQMRGPRALALDEPRLRLYVLNKISNTVSVIGTGGGALLAEVPVGSHDPRPTDVREGRGFLFDARLSGNGTISCATCHLDADLDGLAWDLGDPGGAEVTVMGKNLAAHDPTPRPRVMHPMKGPMTTQTLRAMFEGAPFHWRGDRPTLQSFNGTFDKLMAGPQLSAADIDSLSAYLLTLMPHPNPNRTFDDGLPSTLNGGNPLRGELLFNSTTGHCSECHSDHDGAGNNIDLPSEIGSSQPIKNPPLRTVYQRRGFDPRNGATTLSGFGLLHDGTGFGLPTVHAYVLDSLSTPADFADVSAFVLCADSGLPPVTGASRTFTTQNVSDAAMLADVITMEARSAAGFSEVAVQGVIGGVRRSFYLDPNTQRFEADTVREPGRTRSELLASLGAGDAITFIGMPYGRGSRVGYDRNYNGVRDRDEPMPSLALERLGNGVRLQWPADATGWALESAGSLDGPWTLVTASRTLSGAGQSLNDPIAAATARFYRLRRTW